MQRKNLFSINLDNDKVIDYEELVIRRESEDMAERRSKLEKQLFGASYRKSIYKQSLKSLISVISLMLGIACS